MTTAAAPTSPAPSAAGTAPATDPPTAAPAGRTSATAGAVWTLSVSLVAAVVVAVLLAAAGLLLARVDVALLALPFVASAAWAWDRRPRPGAPRTLAVDVDSHPEGGELGYVLSVDAPAGTEGVELRVVNLGGETQQVVVGVDAARSLRGRVPVLHSGPQELLRIEYRLIATDASGIGAPSDPLTVNRVIPPPYRAIATVPLPRRLQGLTGTHDSARPGDGGDFRDIHPFAPGDRLRRIDWKATARRGQFAGDLYVRRTSATADATVIVVLDSSDDVGERVAEWSRNTAADKGTGSLDVAREAASSLAAGYIKVGDRVGFQDLAGHNRMIAHGGGSRHLWRLLRAIERTEPSGTRTYRQRPPIVAPGALIYVLATFLDDDAVRLAGLWRGSGHRVIAVDVLPTPRFDGASRSEGIAHRIIMMERSDRMRSLEAAGVELLRWQDTGTSDSREARLRALSRPVRGGR